MVELTARVALESMMAATDDDATPIIRRLARIQARTVLDRMKATPDAAASEVGEVERLRAALQYARNLIGPDEVIDAALTTQGGAEG